ncbi:MAG: hypothetical protein K2Y07_12055 [Nitrosomonas sp.]|nr:hypothetical protein [Nitrosomonas sp.]
MHYWLLPWWTDGITHHHLRIGMGEYEKARAVINQETDEMPDMPEIPELSSAIKKYWTMLQATLERFMKTIPDF